MSLAEQDEPSAGATRMMSARERRCIVTGEILPEARLLRFVLAPDGEIVPDVEAKLPGRGIWVSAGRAAIGEAIAKRLFAKAAKAQVRIGPEVIIEISDLKHTGCSKFAKRYGPDAKTFANNKQGTALHLRGRYARIVRGGQIRVGDKVAKHPSNQ